MTPLPLCSAKGAAAPAAPAPPHDANSAASPLMWNPANMPVMSQLPAGLEGWAGSTIPQRLTES